MSIDLDRAELLLSEALGEIRTHDVIPTVTEALAALYRSVGEAPHAVVVDAGGYRDENENVECSCPRELVDRGGWRSQCPVHGNHL